MTDITVNSNPSVVEVSPSNSTIVVNTTSQDVTVAPVQQNVVVDGTGPSTTINTQTQEINVETTQQVLDVTAPGPQGPPGPAGSGGGTTVVANPTTDPTDPALNSITIDGTDYRIEGGGTGSGLDIWSPILGYEINDVVIDAQSNEIFRALVSITSIATPPIVLTTVISAVAGFSNGAFRYNILFDSAQVIVPTAEYRVSLNGIEVTFLGSRINAAGGPMGAPINWFIDATDDAGITYVRGTAPTGVQFYTPGEVTVTQGPGVVNNRPDLDEDRWQQLSGTAIDDAERYSLHTSEGITWTDPVTNTLVQGRISQVEYILIGPDVIQTPGTLTIVITGLRPSFANAARTAGFISSHFEDTANTALFDTSTTTQLQADAGILTSIAFLSIDDEGQNVPTPQQFESILLTEVDQTIQLGVIEELPIGVTVDNHVQAGVVDGDDLNLFYGTDATATPDVTIDVSSLVGGGGLTDLVVQLWDQDSAYVDRELVDFNNKLFVAINDIPAAVSSVNRAFNLGSATYTAATDTYRFQLSGDFDPVAGTTYFMFLRWNAQNGVPTNNYTFSIDGADVTKTVDANNLAIWTFTSSDVTAVPNPGQPNIDIQAQGVNLVFVVSRLANNYADSYVSDEGIVFVNQSPLSDFGGRQWSGELGGVIYNIGRQYEIGDVVFFNEELYYADTRPAPGALPSDGGAWVNYGVQTGGNTVTDGPEGFTPLSIGIGRYAFNNNLRVTPSTTTVATTQGLQPDGVEVNATTSLIYDEDGATLITPADRIRLDNTISVALTTDADGDIEAALTSNTILRNAVDLDLGTVTTVFPPRPFTNGAGDDITGTFSGALRLNFGVRSGNILSAIQNGATADRDDISGEFANGNDVLGVLAIEYEDAAATMPTGNQFIIDFRTANQEFTGFGFVQVGLRVSNVVVHAGTATDLIYDNTRFYTVGTQGSSTTTDREEFDSTQFGKAIVVQGARTFEPSQANAAAPDYLTGTKYRQGALVTSDSRVWIAIQPIAAASSTLPEDDAINWREVGSADNSITSVSILGNTITFTFADGTTQDITTPLGDTVEAGRVAGDNLLLYYGTDTSGTADVTIDVSSIAGDVTVDNHVQAGVVDGDDLNLFYGTDTTGTPDVTVDVSSLAGGGSVRPNIGQLRTAIFDEYIDRVPDTRNAEGSLLTRNWTVRGTNVLEEFIRETNGSLIEKVYTGPLVTSFAPDSVNIELLRVFTRNAEGNVISDMWEFGVSSGLMTSASYRFYPGFERNAINFRNVPVGSVTQTGRVVDFDDTVFTVVGRDVQLV